MSDKTGKKSGGEETRVLNPATDTLVRDVELAKAVDALLIVVRGQFQGKKYHLINDSYIIGRDKDADIQVDDQNVSRQHLRVWRESGDNFSVEDVGSRNGTFLNEQKLEGKKELKKEDMIRLGSTILKYLPKGAIETMLQANMSDKINQDELTGLINKRYIVEALESEFKRAKALHSKFSIIMFDLDNFKKINDSHGHPCGDYVLKTIGAIMKSVGLGPRDLAGRYGGEEFVVISNYDQAQAQDLAEKIRKKIESYEFVFEGKQIPVTVSLGIATDRKEFLTPDDILKSADNALYTSKRLGKNRLTVA